MITDCFSFVFGLFVFLPLEKQQKIRLNPFFTVTQLHSILIIKTSFKLTSYTLKIGNHNTVTEGYGRLQKKRCCNRVRRFVTITQLQKIIGHIKSNTVVAEDKKTKTQKNVTVPWLQIEALQINTYSFFIIFVTVVTLKKGFVLTLIKKVALCF